MLQRGAIGPSALVARRGGNPLGWVGQCLTVLRSGPYRVYFYSQEPNEPPHVHIDRDDRTAQFWLVPVALARNFGFPPRELTHIEALIQQQQQTLLEAWNDHFGP